MNIIKAGYEIMGDINAKEIYKKIESAGRTCYKSEDKITDESAEKFVRGLIKRGHEAMLEHASMTVKFIVDRGISHEQVRHRIASFAQESTRYCNYSSDKFGKEITVIEPCFYADIPDDEKKLCKQVVDDPAAYEDDHVADFLERMMNIHKRYARWYEDCRYAERGYFQLLELGATPQEARNVLPTSVKTEVVVTSNMREWRHILNLRAAGTTGAPHPQMVEVMLPLLAELKEKLPAIFDDIQIVGN